MTRTCPACAEPAPDEAAWCEACGSDLAGPDGAEGTDNADPADPAAAVTTQPCVACGAAPTEITSDGWCEQCGQRQPSPRDHEVLDLGWLAGASDKGKTHHQNEDSMAVWAGEQSGRAVIVVCDGVSSTELPEEASAAASAAAVEVLQLAAQAGEVSDADFASATEAAKAQVASVWRSSTRAADPPSCTFVSAATNQEGPTVDVRVAWLGDSRAYWLSDTSAELLTTDHSWAEQQRELGELDEAAITSDPRAHSITRWIGLDAGDVTPEVRDFTFDVPGRLVVCSDGLWNYAEQADALRSVVERSAGESEAELAEALVTFANEGGGHDNITVVSAHFTAVETEGAGSEMATETVTETGAEGSG